MLTLFTTNVSGQSVPVNTPANISICVGQPVSITINCPVEFNKPSSITVLRGSSGFIIPAPPVSSEGFQYINPAVGVGTLIWKSTSVAGLYQFRTSCRGNAATSPRVTAVSYVTVLPPPSLSIAASEPCGQGPVSLTAVGCANGDIKWATGETSAILNVSAVNSSMTYSATCTVGTGCVATAKRTIGPKPTVILTPGSLTVCNGEKVNLTARSETGTSYRWNTGATTASISVTTSGSYAVAVTDSRGCSTSATASIVLARPVSVSITPQSLTLCEGQTAVLTALGTDNITGYKWNTGATSETVVATKSGTYAVEVTTEGGCSARASTFITVLPKLTIKTSSTNVCANQSVALATNGCEKTKVLWSTGTTGAEIVIKPAQTTVISVTCLASLCSANTASMTINVVAPPSSPTITGSQTACYGNVISLTAVCETGTALWNGASRNGVFVGTASRTGELTYMAICTNEVNCANSSTYSVTVAAPPSLSASPNTAVCIGEPLTLTASCSTGAVVWNNATTGNSFVVNTSVAGINTISISCSNGAGCSNQIIRQISIGTLSSFSLVNTQTYPASGTSIIANVPETFTYVAASLPATVALVGSVCGTGAEFSYSISKVGAGTAPVVYRQQNTTLTVPGSSTTGIPALGAGRYVATIMTPTGLRIINFTIIGSGAGRIASPETIAAELSVKVLSNPVVNDAEIIVEGAGGTTLNLFLSDMQGRPVHSFTQQDAPASFRYRLPMSSQPAGLYILKAAVGTQQKSVRILKGN